MAGFAHHEPWLVISHHESLVIMVRMIGHESLPLTGKGKLLSPSCAPLEIVGEDDSTQKAWVRLLCSTKVSATAAALARKQFMIAVYALLGHPVCLGLVPPQSEYGCSDA